MYLHIPLCVCLCIIGLTMLVSVTLHLSLIHRYPMWAGPWRLLASQMFLFSGKASVCARVCAHACVRVSVWICVPYAVCQGGLSGTYWCAYIVVNNSSKRIQRWQLWCVWQFCSRKRQDLVTHVHMLACKHTLSHKTETSSSAELCVFVKFSIFITDSHKKKRVYMHTYEHIARSNSATHTNAHTIVQA